MKNFEGQRMGRENRRNPADMLKDILASQSRLTNETVEKEYDLNDLLLRDATLNPKAYEDIYSVEALQADAEFVREREVEFSGAHNPNVQDFYRTEYGAQIEEDIIAKWRENKSREKNGQMEMAITALLSQKLGENFLVVRTAPYDDYKNGVDNLILDRVTGEVIGAFDEVHEGGDGRRTEEKKAKVNKIAKRGGAEIRYGLQLKDNKLTHAKLEGVPVFYLGLASAELVELVQGLGDNDSTKTDKTFEKLVASLATQHEEISKYASSSKLHSRLVAFGQSLSRLMNTDERKVA